MQVPGGEREAWFHLLFSRSLCIASFVLWWSSRSDFTREQCFICLDLILRRANHATHRHPLRRSVLAVVVVSDTKIISSLRFDWFWLVIYTHFKRDVYLGPTKCWLTRDFNDSPRLSISSTEFAVSAPRLPCRYVPLRSADSISK